MARCIQLLSVFLSGCLVAAGVPMVSAASAEQDDAAAQVGAVRGICVVLEKVAEPDRELLGRMVRDTDWIFFFQASDKDAVADAYRFACEQKLL
ncbi:MAG: hypothetical protein ACYC6Y_31550, partial [Thermoguttaceae bacterium]